jgi:hypothetical protein
MAQRVSQPACAESRVVYSRGVDFRGLTFGATLALLLQIEEGARAHDLEHLAQAALHPRDPNMMVLRFVQGGDGLFYTDDGGASWRLLCKSAIYPERALIQDAIVGADGHVLLATFSGVYEDDGHGCGWAKVPALGERWVLDFARHPTEPEVIFAVASDELRSAFGLLRRDGNGTWTELGSEPDRVVQRVHAAQTSAGLRLYTSALVDTVPVDGVDMQNYVIRVSDDEGASWREHPFGPTDGGFRLEGVDPSDPDRLIAVIHRPERPGETLEQSLDQALVSTDQGETFSHYLVLSQSSNVAFAPDGRLWIGDLGSSRHPKAVEGLWVAPDLTTPPEQLAEFPVACLAHQPGSDALLTCQRWWFGTVDAAGTFSAFMRFQDVDELVQCAGADHAASCQQQLCRSYCHLEHFAQAPACEVYAEVCAGGEIAPPGGGAGGAAAVADGGAVDAGAAGTGAPARRDARSEAGDADERADAARNEGGCACGAAGAPKRGGALAAVLGGAAVVLARRVRKRGR